MKGEGPDVPMRQELPSGFRTVRADKSVARRTAILEAALDEFCKGGFAATRVQDVAARASVAKGTIYLNFKDKQTLFEELIRSTLGAHVDRLVTSSLPFPQLTKGARSGRVEPIPVAEKSVFTPFSASQGKHRPEIRLRHCRSLPQPTQVDQ